MGAGHAGGLGLRQRRQRRPAVAAGVVGVDVGDAGAVADLAADLTQLASRYRTRQTPEGRPFILGLQMAPLPADAVVPAGQDSPTAAAAPSSNTTDVDT